MRPATCPAGHSVDLDEGRFCKECGRPATCPAGHPVTRLDASYCDTCGAALAGEATAPSYQPPVAAVEPAPEAARPTATQQPPPTPRPPLVPATASRGVRVTASRTLVAGIVAVVALGIAIAAGAYFLVFNDEMTDEEWAAQMCQIRRAFLIRIDNSDDFSIEYYTQDPLAALRHFHLAALQASEDLDALPASPITSASDIHARYYRELDSLQADAYWAWVEVERLDLEDQYSAAVPKLDGFYARVASLVDETSDWLFWHYAPGATPECVDEADRTAPENSLEPQS